METYSYERIARFSVGDGAVPLRVAPPQASGMPDQRDHMLMAEPGREAETVARQMVARGVQSGAAGEILGREAQALMAQTALPYGEAFERVKADPKNRALVLIYSGAAERDAVVAEMQRHHTPAPSSVAAYTSTYGMVVTAG